MNKQAKMGIGDHQADEMPVDKKLEKDQPSAKL